MERMRHRAAAWARERSRPSARPIAMRVASGLSAVTMATPSGLASCIIVAFSLARTARIFAVRTHLRSQRTEAASLKRRVQSAKAPLVRPSRFDSIFTRMSKSSWWRAKPTSHFPAAKSGVWSSPAVLVIDGALADREAKVRWAVKLRAL